MVQFFRKRNNEKYYTIQTSLTLVQSTSSINLDEELFYCSIVFFVRFNHNNKSKQERNVYIFVLCGKSGVSKRLPYISKKLGLFFIFIWLFFMNIHDSHNNSGKGKLFL